MAVPQQTPARDAWRSRLVAITTPAEFTTELRELKGRSGRSVKNIAKRGKIGAGTVQNLVTDGTRVPQRPSVEGFLTGCGVSQEDERKIWLETYSRVYPPPALPATTARPGQRTRTDVPGQVGGTHGAGFQIETGSAHRNHLLSVTYQQRAETYLQLVKWSATTKDKAHLVNDIFSLHEAIKIPGELDARITAFASDDVRQAIRNFREAWFRVHKAVQREDERLRTVLATTPGGTHDKLAAMLEVVPEYEMATQATQQLHAIVRQEMRPPS